MANATPAPPSNTTSEPPGTPRSLRARAQGDSEIELSWREPRSRVDEGITGYRIEVSPDGATWEDLVVDTGSNATMYTHSNLMGGTTRYYRDFCHKRSWAWPALRSYRRYNRPVRGLPGPAAGDNLSGNPEFVQCLIREGGQDANARGPNGYPLLYWALSQRKRVNDTGSG